MTISYNWLCDYLPVKIEIEKLSKILTSIGLEVESVHQLETFKGGLKGLVTGEVLSCEKHPDADKLRITTVNTGAAEPLQIVCGAANVAVGQKVIVALPGTTIYPISGDPLTLKKAKIRGVESNGMICAEDEIGVGNSHDGIMVLPADTAVGKPAAELYNASEDFEIEIGLTPNRMDAMSHLGVARDVCAYLSHHEKKNLQVKSPYPTAFKADNNSHPVSITIEDATACRRYSGVSLSNITVGDSPEWLQEKLKSIGLKPINNIVDVTNFILHETGQPLHAFDADRIAGNSIVVRKAHPDEAFVTLDNKEKKLSDSDLVIANNSDAMCIAGVYGGLNSGVTAATTRIFLESAWFNPETIRKTSVKHGLRTDAATRFEKGVDISNTVNVLKRAALLIRQVAGGTISSEVVDIYPTPLPQPTIALKHHYLKKLSGKNYHSDTVKNILEALGFEWVKEGADDVLVKPPYSKPDISIPADIVEEIMRIDGLDNIDIPSVIAISPSVSTHADHIQLKEKTANYLVGLGFSEIFTNSITNSAYYPEEVLGSSVKMINSLSSELDILRPSMLETGLEVVAHNLNRKNNNLQLFEFGKTYSSSAVGQYGEAAHLALFLCGAVTETGWQAKGRRADYYHLKAVVERLSAVLGLKGLGFEVTQDPNFEYAVQLVQGRKRFGIMGKVRSKSAESFGIKEPVFFADIYWTEVLASKASGVISYREVPKFPAVERDLALVLDKSVTYAQVEQSAKKNRIEGMKSIRLFDLFESEKLGAGKISMAVSFTFLDETKTLTDKEIDAMMAKLIQSFEKDLGAEIRK